MAHTSVKRKRGTLRPLHIGTLILDNINYAIENKESSIEQKRES